MRNSLHSVIIILILCTLFCIQTKAQQTSAVSKNKYEDASSWKAAKINNGSNIINGVEFYKKTSGETVYVKLVNTNSYSVKVEWVESNGTKKEVTVAANTTLEGSTDESKKDTEEGKLVFIKQTNNQEKQQYQIKFIVSQVK